MKLKADIELKLRRFFRRFGKGIIVVAIIFFIIVGVDRFIKNSKTSTPQTTYTPNVPVMDETSSVPKKVQKSMEQFIDEYIGYCNNGDYNKAYEMISEDCKTEYFGSYLDFVNYAKRKFPTPKKYAIQSYSIYNDKYIYSVKLFDDFLATGISNGSFRYLEEKMVASYDENKNVVFSVDGFIEKNKIQSVQENKYLKADIQSQILLYDLERYMVKLTNRSNNTIIIQNYDADTDEIVIDLGNQTRSNENTEEVILEPGESRTIATIFSKGFDNGYTTKSLIFTSVRVLDENQNEIDKFSMTLGF